MVKLTPLEQQKRAKHLSEKYLCALMRHLCVSNARFFTRSQAESFTKKYQSSSVNQIIH